MDHTSRYSLEDSSYIYRRVYIDLEDSSYTWILHSVCKSGVELRAAGKAGTGRGNRRAGAWGGRDRQVHGAGGQNRQVGQEKNIILYQFDVFINVSLATWYSPAAAFSFWRLVIFLKMSVSDVT